MKDCGIWGWAYILVFLLGIIVGAWVSVYALNHLNRRH